MFAQCSGSWTTQPSASSSGHHSIAHRRSYSSRHPAPWTIPPVCPWCCSAVRSCSLGQHCLVTFHRDGSYFSVFSVSFLARLSNQGQLISTASTLLWSTNRASTLLARTKSVFCVNRHIPKCLSVCWHVHWFGLHLWVPRTNRVGKLGSLSAFKRTALLIQHYACPYTSSALTMNSPPAHEQGFLESFRTFCTWC